MDGPRPDLAPVPAELDPGTIHCRNTTSSAILHVHHVFHNIVAVIIVCLRLPSARAAGTPVQGDQVLGRPAKPLTSESQDFRLLPGEDPALTVPELTITGVGVVLDAFALARIFQTLGLALLQRGSTGNVVILRINLRHAVPTAHAVAEARPGLPSPTFSETPCRVGTSHRKQWQKHELEQAHNCTSEHGVTSQADKLQYRPEI
mmetsp:Transcript_13047/g.31138  ORF Transcript_13047/g.31138 Transcript_13047/m.31138 type:complete len:204 (+) Transcript_13047:370-981(+)